MSRSSTILRNITSNWIGFAVNAGVTLVLTPFVLHELGEARYGVWILTSCVIGYYGFLDLGFRAGVTQYLTRYLAIRDYDKSNECLSTAVAAFSALGVLLVALSVVAAYGAPSIFNFPQGLEYEAFWCILIVGLSSAMQFAFFPFAAVFSATQRFDIANLIGIGTRLLTAVSIFVALWTGCGLIGVSVATCGASLVDYLIRWRVSYRLVPEMEVSWRRAKFEQLREIGSFGAWNFLISINSYVYQYVPTILIGAFMPIAAVGHYALATGLLRQINSLLSPVGQVIYPAATALHAQGDVTGLERLYHDGSRLMMLVMIPVVLVAAFWAEDFYRLWIGEKYLRGVPFHSVALLFQILLISTVTNFSTNIAAQIMVGAGRVRLVSLAQICGSIINLTCSLILIFYWGLAGIAIAVVIASLVIDLIVMPLLLQKALRLSIKDFLRRACVRPVAAGALQAIFIMFIRHTWHPNDWLNMILHGVLAGIGSVVVLLSIGVTASERERFLVQPIRDFVRREMPPTVDTNSKG